MTRSRRDVLRMSGASVAAALTAGFAGCSSISESLPGGGGGNGGGGSSGLSGVPAGVSAVARGDVTKTLNDSAITQFTNAVLDMAAQNESYTGPTDKQGLLDRFSQSTGLDLSKASTAVGYLKYPSGETPSGRMYSALQFDAEWAESDVIGAFEQNQFSFQKGTYEGHAIYEPSETYRFWLGVLGSNSYVAGSEDAVRETIDVAEGNVESLSGDLKSAYSSVRSAPFRFASAVPEQQLPSESAQVGGSTIAVDQLAAVNHVAGATYHDGDTVGIVVRMLTGGSSEAEDVRNIIAGAVSAAEGMKINETISKALDDVSVTRDGSVVVAEVSGSVERATRLIEVVVGQFVYGQQAADTARQ